MMLKAPFDLDTVQPEQFLCPKCHELAWRQTQRVAHYESGEIACASCLLDQVMEGHGRLVGRYSAVIEENPAGFTPGKWTMTSCQMRLS